MTGSHEVVGSIPISSTRLNQGVSRDSLTHFSLKDFKNFLSHGHFPGG